MTRLSDPFSVVCTIGHLQTSIVCLFSYHLCHYSGLLADSRHRKKNLVLPLVQLSPRFIQGNLETLSTYDASDCFL